MTNISINNRTSFFDSHQRFKDAAPSKIIQELSQRDLVRGNILIASGALPSSPKRKRGDDEHVIGKVVTSQKRLEVNDDAGYCRPGVQKHFEPSSSWPQPTYYDSCLSSYDVERRDGPSDDVLSVDDETACPVSTFCLPVFRRGRPKQQQQQQQQDSSSASDALVPTIWATTNDNENERADSYSDFPSITRARTITDSFDSMFSKRCCYADPPEMEEPLRSSWSAEEIEENHKADHRFDCSDHRVLGLHRHELNYASDETRECPERIASIL